MQLPKMSPPAPARPQQVPHVQQVTPASPPGRRWLWWILPVLAVLGVAGWLWTRQSEADRAGQALATSVRSFTVHGGVVEETLRLTGTTMAERAAGILAPQMRGSRSGFGRDARSFTASAGRGSGGSSMGGSSGGSSGGGGGGGGGSSSSSSSSAANLTASIGASSGGGDSSGSSSGGGMQSSRSASAMRSATSRVSSGARTSSSSSRSSSGSAAASSAMGEGLGSAASGLPGGGGGGGSRGGGGGEFGLTLENAAKPGTLVKKGDIVATFDRQYMLTRLDDYKAGVEQTQAAFRKMEADQKVNKESHQQTIAVAKAQLDKAQLDMKTLPVLSAMDSERRRLALEEAQARYKQLLEEVRHVDVGIRSERRVAELSLRQSEIELKRAEANVSRMEMKAPIDGLVVMQSLFRGGEFDQVKVGDQLYPGMMFMQIVDPSSMIISATVNQTDVERLRIGQKARVRFDAFPDLELPARVYSIGSVGKSSRYRPDWLREMTVMLKIEKMDPRVIPDLSVSCDVILNSTSAPALAPREAVFYESGGDGQAQPFVYVRAGDGQWQRRNVTLGLASNIRVAVTSGLQPQEVIALEPPPKVAATARRTG